MKKRFSIIAYINLVALSVFWMGCSARIDRNVSAVNKPSGLVLTGRYVSSRKSVKVNVVDKRLRFEFGLPNKQSRINNSRVHVNLKSFDFGEWVKTDRRGWFNHLAANSSPTCADQTQHFVTSLPSLGGTKTKDLGVTFHQRSDGVIIITIHRSHEGDTPLVKLEIHLKQGMDSKTVTCVYQWKSQKELEDIASHLMNLRNSFILELSKETGFNGAEIGTRLSRHKEPKSDTPPHSKDDPSSMNGNKTRGAIQPETVEPNSPGSTSNSSTDPTEATNDAQGTPNAPSSKPES